MDEIELKFQVAAAQQARVRAFVAGRQAGASGVSRLQALYFDTADRSLARAAIALRLRREDGRWVQTLKASGDDQIGRSESNLELGPAAAAPDVDPHRHADSEAGQRLLRLLAEPGAGALCCRYRTDIRRTTRRLRTRYGSVELAYDEGTIRAGDRSVAVAELEIELLHGHPLAVLDVARRWAPRFGLWLDTRSKAERGDMLARGVDRAAPCDAAPFALRPEQGAAEALLATIAACRAQILPNASQVASGRFDDEHLHQLRIGLRRLRSALKLFADEAGSAGFGETLADPAALLFRGLGTARDRAVIAGQMTGAISAALHRSDPAARLAALPGDAASATPPDLLLRQADSQRLLLALIEAGLPADPRRAGAGRPAPASGSDARRSLQRQLARRLAHWQRSVARDARAFASLDDAGRHRLRKHCKRLRYGIEMTASLFDRKSVSRSLKTLKRAQQWLGDLNDVVTARRAFAAQRESDPAAWFALGWLEARRDALLDAAAPSLRKLAKAKNDWTR